MKRYGIFEKFDKGIFGVAGFFLGLICVGVYVNFSLYPALFIGGANVILALCFSKYLRSSRRKEEESRVARICYDLHHILDPSHKVDDGDGDEYAYAFTEISSLQKRLNLERDNMAKIADIVDSAVSHVDLTDMLGSMVPKILNITNSNCGAFYLANISAGKLELKFSLGFNKSIYSELDITIGEGLIGVAAGKNGIEIINNIPKDTEYVSRTFMGSALPKSLMVVPVSNEGELIGTLVLSSIFDYDDNTLQLAKQVQYYLGLAAAGGIVLENSRKVAGDLKFQNKLIQDYNEELEKKLSERSILFDNVIDSIREYAIYSMDKEGNITTWNKGAESLLGYTADEVLGKHCEIIYPEDEVKNGLVRRRFSIVNNEGKYNEYVWRSKKGGKRYYADTTLYAIKNGADEIIGYTNVTRDISAIKTLEANIAAEVDLRRILINNDPTPLVLCDSTGFVKQANEAALNLLEIDAHLLNHYIFSELIEIDKETHSSIIKALSARKIFNLSNIKIKNKGIYINIQIVPLSENLAQTGIIYAFNKYVKDESESCNWSK